MIHHTAIDGGDFAGKRRLVAQIHQQFITLAGNRALKIYGTLRCRSGKRMKDTNRVFFINEQEARKNGYRPCAHCMHKTYLLWRENI